MAETNERRRRDRIAFTRGMAGAAMKSSSIVRRCTKCGLGIMKYPGRYPGSCPQCDGEIEVVEGLDEGASWAERVRDASTHARVYELQDRLGFEMIDVPSAYGPWAAVVVKDPTKAEQVRQTLGSLGVLFASGTKMVDGYPALVVTGSRRNEGVVVGGGPIISCVSHVPRIQRVIDASTRNEAPDPRSSNSFVVRSDVVSRAIPGGFPSLVSFMEGPINGRYYRVEDPGAPVIILEVDEDYGVLFATENPGAYIGHDPRNEFVDTIITEEFSSQVGAPRKPGEGQTSPYGGFRIHVGANQTRKPRKDMIRSVQNKLNAKRGLAKRVAAAKDWHRSPAGARLHRALGRYNARNNMKVESLTTWVPRTEHLIEASSQYAETIDDVLDGILRKLLVIEALDILQDVEFDEVSGSIYLFFDPTLPDKEMEEITLVLRSEYSAISVVASPDGRLAYEQGQGADWWVLYLPRAREGQPLPPPNPAVYGGVVPPALAPGAEMRQTLLVPAPLGTPEQMADQIDVQALVRSLGERFRGLPEGVAQKVAQRMGYTRPPTETP